MRGHEHGKRTGDIHMEGTYLWRGHKYEGDIHTEETYRRRNIHKTRTERIYTLKGHTHGEIYICSIYT